MKNRKGFLAMSTVLIVSAIVMAIAVSVSLIGIGEGKTGLIHWQGSNALYLAEGCMEDALLKLRASAIYSGGTITRPEGSCTVTVTGSGTYTVTVTATNASATRSIQAIATRSGKVAISSWKEL
jgi:hypothetical protein